MLRENRMRANSSARCCASRSWAVVFSRNCHSARRSQLPLFTRGVGGGGGITFQRASPSGLLSFQQRTCSRGVGGAWPGDGTRWPWACADARGQQGCPARARVTTGQARGAQAGLGSAGPGRRAAQRRRLGGGPGGAVVAWRPWHFQPPRIARAAVWGWLMISRKNVTLGRAHLLGASGRWQAEATSVFTACDVTERGTSC